MKQFRLLIILTLLVISHASGQAVWTDVEGFPDEVNDKIEKFLNENVNYEGRKIAAFDGDGTVLGQAPHYLADEAMYTFAKENPDKINKEVLKEMVTQSNVSLPYVQNRIKLIAGMSLQDYRDMGEAAFKKYYSDKIYEPMRALIKNLEKNGFEIWIVTASPEGMYQQFLSKEFDIPITNIIGVKSVIRNGIITDEIIHPVPQDEGKMEAIESFIQDKPLFVAGNSRGDKDMIEFSKGIKMVINPDTFVAPDQTESVADYAKKHDWLIVRIKDVPAENFPSLSGKEFGIKTNKTNDVK